MSQHREVVESLAVCFNRQDWVGMLPMLTDDVERWEVGAPQSTRGKKEFEQEMAPGPDVTDLREEITRMVEEGNVVACEGKVRVSKKDGKVINVRFCNLYEFEGEKVKRITAYGIVV